MYYEIRMYTPVQGKLDDYAQVFETLPKKAFENLGAKVLAQWAQDDAEQPAFVYLLQFRDKAHRAAVFSKLRDAPEMRDYIPQRRELIDANVKDQNWLLRPLKNSVLD